MYIYKSMYEYIQFEEVTMNMRLDDIDTPKDDENQIVVKNGEGGLTVIRWTNRRRMAWTALLSMIGITLALLFAPIAETRIRILAEPITWFYFAMASVIGAYMGFTTWASKR